MRVACPTFCTNQVEKYCPLTLPIMVDIGQMARERAATLRRLIFICRLEIGASWYFYNEWASSIVPVFISGLSL